MGARQRQPQRLIGSEPNRLSSIWQQASLRAQDEVWPHRPWCLGHGWLQRAGIVDVLEPVLSPESSDGSFFRFGELGAGPAEKLLRLLPEDYLESERQNDGPRIGTVLRAVVAHPERLRAHGYVIGPTRCDERITVEGVLLRLEEQYRLCPAFGPALDGCDCETLVTRMTTKFGVDDARVRPHELDRASVEQPGGSGPASVWYRAWWD